jgi:hypothetical protein
MDTAMVIADVLAMQRSACGTDEKAQKIDASLGCS